MTDRMMRDFLHRVQAIDGARVAFTRQGASREAAWTMALRLPDQPLRLARGSLDELVERGLEILDDRVQPELWRLLLPPSHALPAAPAPASAATGGTPSATPEALGLEPIEQRFPPLHP